MLTGRISSAVGLSSLFLSPMVGSLADTFGRLPFQYISALGTVIWQLYVMHASSAHRGSAGRGVKGVLSTPLSTFLPPSIRL
jgi:hypothetical protein